MSESHQEKPDMENCLVGLDDIKDRAPWPDPTPEMLADPLFEVIWQIIKRWDVNVPDVYSGYMGATGNHVRAILDAISAEITACEVASAEAMREACAVAAWGRGMDDYRCHSTSHDSREVGARAASDIRALPIPHADALSRALAAAEKRGMAKAAAIAKAEKDRLWQMQQSIPSAPNDIVAGNRTERLRDAVAARAGTASEIEVAIRNAAAQESKG